jgi:hypothetical protein
MSIPGSYPSFRFKVAFVIAVALTGLIVFPFIFARSRSQGAYDDCSRPTASSTKRTKARSARNHQRRN